MHKIQFLNTIVTAVIFLLLGSCTLETSDNGDLDGMWHLTRVDTLATGGQRDMVADRVFWSFQVRMVNVRCLATGVNMVSHFTHTDGTLQFQTFYLNNREGGAPEVTDSLAYLFPYVAIQRMDETFRVEKLNSSDMILAGDVLRLTFEKY